MKTIDSLLAHLISSGTIDSANINPSDKTTLNSLFRSLISTRYITSNQSKLIIRILRNNQVELESISYSDFTDMLETPIFEKEFRMLQQVKRAVIRRDVAIHLLTAPVNEVIEVTIAYAPNIVNALRTTKLWSPGNNTSTHTVFVCHLTEKNVVLAVEQLQSLDVNISDELIELYETIKSWNEAEIRNQFSLTEIKNQSFQKQLTADLGTDTILSDLIVNDRSLRYQYLTHNEVTSNSLPEIIANRQKPRIWINNEEYSIKDVISALITLKRLPILLVFGSSAETQLVSELAAVSEALVSLNIHSNVGIYFRLSNNGPGKLFNNLIAERQYNCVLNHDTQIAGVNTTKLPKFFVKEKWTPMSVLCINTTLRHSKTAVYAENASDLIITYTSAEPIIETRNRWEYD